MPRLQDHDRPAAPVSPHGARTWATVRLVAAAAALASGLAASPAAAHEYWLSPSRYMGTPHQTVEVGALAGTGFRGERKPFTSSRCVRFVVRAGRQLDLAPLAREGEYLWGRFAPSDSGGATFAFESDFTPISLPAAEFDAYLETEGLDSVLAARRRAAAQIPGRERYRRCAKAWLSGADPARATTPIGMPLEIVPLAAPGTAGQLRVRVLWQGRPLAGALIRGWRAPLAENGSLIDPEERDSMSVAWRARTDARGEATAQVAAAGEWLVSVVRMVSCADTAVADWESTWASLTFERFREAGR